jgi:hypothetical protein
LTQAVMKFVLRWLSIWSDVNEKTVKNLIHARVYAKIPSALIQPAMKLFPRWFSVQ